MENRPDGERPTEASDTAVKGAEFIKETVKARPKNRMKLVRRTATSAFLAVVFGLIACVTILVLEPILSNWIYPKSEPEEITFAEEPEEEEILPEDMLLEEEPETEIVHEIQETRVIQTVELTASNYRTLYNKLRLVAAEAERSVVTVTAVNTAEGWLDDMVENLGESTGLILSQSAAEIQILAPYAVVAEAEQLYVTFVDGSQIAAEVKHVDDRLGLCVLSASPKELRASTIAKIAPAVMGLSFASMLGTPVLAVGYPLGDVKSLEYGMITSQERTVDMVDGSYHLLTTDIYGGTNASGVIVNVNGRVLGIISSEHNSPDTPNMITAISISDLKGDLESLMDGNPVPVAGIYGMDVPLRVQEEQGMPAGAYVEEIEMDSPAMAAGIQRGDVIVEMNGEAVTGYAEYHRILTTLSGNDRVRVVLMRASAEGYVEVEAELLLEQ